MKSGKLDIDGILLEPHEVAAIEALIATGKRIKLLRPSRDNGVKTPDILIGNNKWEIKSPKSNGKYTIQHAFKAAARQSNRMIFDIRRIEKIPEENIIKKIKKEFSVSKTVKQVKVIIKSGKVIDINK
jgi:hypothetical protein